MRAVVVGGYRSNSQPKTEAGRRAELRGCSCFLLICPPPFSDTCSIGIVSKDKVKPRCGVSIAIAAAVIVCALLALATQGSATRPPPSDPLGNTAAAPRVYARRARCPEGQWRQLSDTELRRSILSLSHIVVRHEDVMPGLVPLSVLDWNLGVPTARRGIEEAYQVADRIVSEVKSKNVSFGEAQRKSEDPLTRARSGRLGVFPASEFSMWPEVLDCLEPLSPGEISTAIATPFGIHVFRRDALPPAETFSAMRLVVGYDGAEFLRHVARSPGIFDKARKRTRTEAKALAEELRARASPENFRDLVAQYSEHRDAANGGDIGVWSSREPSIFPRLLDSILALPLGGLSEPLDSELGFQIFLRTEPSTRTRFALRARRLAFDPDADETEPESSSAILRMAEGALAGWRALLAEGMPAAQLPDLGELETWTLGRGPDGVDEAIQRVSPGQLILAPVRSDYTYLIGLRVEPQAYDEEPAGSEWLPSTKGAMP